MAVANRTMIALARSAVAVLAGICILVASPGGALSSAEAVGPRVEVQDTAEKGENASTPQGAQPSDGETDFDALSAQIKRLGQLLREFREAAASSVRSLSEEKPRGGIAGIPPTVPAGEVKAVYGPDGPTERSVRALLEYRLVVVGNPRLKAGEVRATPDGIVAEVVTARESALVERFLVDRSSGAWRALH